MDTTHATLSTATALTTHDTDIDTTLATAATSHTTIEADVGDATGASIGGSLTDGIEAIETQIAFIVQTGSGTMAAGAEVAVLTAVNTGIMYITVDTTANGGTGTVIQVANADVCTDVAILVADSPFTCAVPVTAGQAVTFEDEDAGGDSAGTVVAVLIASVADTT